MYIADLTGGSLYLSSVEHSNYPQLLTAWRDGIEVGFYKNPGDSGFLTFIEGKTTFYPKVFMGSSLQFIPDAQAVSTNSPQGVLIFNLDSKDIYHLEGTEEAVSHHWVQHWAGSGDPHQHYVAVVIHEGSNSVLRIYSLSLPSGGRE